MKVSKRSLLPFHFWILASSYIMLFCTGATPASVVCHRTTRKLYMYGSRIIPREPEVYRKLRKAQVIDHIQSSWSSIINDCFLTIGMPLQRSSI
ncbi:uncharacterized protein C8R40DRAFT_485390 [Lentinula edodes]|uniref:uncharacterized protein n=1 Tax=Lentinula edodes TaxID=5353 RepID=UPI001E8D1DBE|nr:uncharacterized protein C8R40DRAFT_485390 [Lentinula edodes]KAH7872476.1 hypothetical protein C8R40DRAFT_485390 [Lentinula edodes]